MKHARSIQLKDHATHRHAAGLTATLLVGTALVLLPKHSAFAADAQEPLGASPRWAIGPFVKLEKPVLSPNPKATFQCPILGKEVRWEEQNVYSPACVVKDGQVHLLYRAEGGNWWKWRDQMLPTSRIGLAISRDGRTFTRHPTPVLYPDQGPMKDREWPFGPTARFRLLLKGSLIEFYLEDLLIDCYSLPQGASGRIGILPAGDPAALTALKAWCP